MFIKEKDRNVEKEENSKKKDIKLGKEKYSWKRNKSMWRLSTEIEIKRQHKLA
jgi:hypothetical protein